MNTLWKNIARDELYAGVAGRPVHRDVRVRILGAKHLRLLVDDAATHEIEAVEIDCDVWIERRDIPVAHWRQYWSADEVLGDVAEVSFDWAGQPATFRLHRLASRIGVAVSR
jgi:hypothetical protein